MRPFPSVPGVEHRFVRARGLSFHVAEAGPPDGEVVVLQHGWPQHWYAWRKLIPRLAERWRVLCPDLRGLGWSDAPAGGYEKEELAADLLAVLDALDVERFRILGHDWGGWVTWLAGLRAPERVERLAVLNMTHPWVKPGLRLPLVLPRLWYAIGVSLPLLGPLGLRAGASWDRAPLLRSWGDVAPAFEGDALEEFLAPLREPDRARATQRIYRSFLVKEGPAALAGRYRREKLTVPGLYLWGDRDPVVTEQTVRGFEPWAPHVQFVRLPGVGHFAAEEAPERVLAPLEPFLAGEPVPATA